MPLCRLLAAALLLVLIGLPGSARALPQNRAVKSRTVPRQVLAACNEMHALAAKTPGVSIRRRTGSFSDQMLGSPVIGCGMTVSGSFAAAKDTGDASVRLRDGFVARGWQEMNAYAADGVDGTAFAFRRADVACHVRGTRNGGADEPELPAQDWYKVTLFCTSPPLPERESR